MTSYSPHRAPYATLWENSRGRFFTEAPSSSRTPFQRDRDRIIHASAFRRLKQKTQVFVAHEGDHYRTRLTHSLEVAQIARSVARTMHLDEDLAEALALAHDIGHPPFGHSGEDQLNHCMAPYEGYDHNAQALRIVTKLEERYPEFNGLNLTWEMLEGLIKHNGPVTDPDILFTDLPLAFRDFEHFNALEPEQFAGPEAQVAALADDIAYNNHDIDDGLTAGLFTIDDLLHIPLVGDVFKGVMLEYPSISQQKIIYESVRRLIGIWIVDLVTESNKRIAELAPESAADIRAHTAPVIAFSNALVEQQYVLRRFLYERMYTHYKVNRKRSQAKRILNDLFDAFLNEPDTLPTEWRVRAERVTGTPRARLVCDYIAGMTDTFAIEEHGRLFHLASMQ